ncbi:hypothetical protein SCOR_03500 [Sulfidibacter corallicola]|uniref:Photosynthesis system II assembly factor Ycf48/Hcf136-like domain-containing protein n=1 Tax=Sulfidibacter corallicola TaxID=2818388 RepID=A0A8A4TEM5_SULCO|nr:hypothetical protein [Sulfidibacter corallicola]QTD48406.1 hypothetical protein J3U87_22735 [Sulfidibacter corallicola]
MRRLIDRQSPRRLSLSSRPLILFRLCILVLVTSGWPSFGGWTPSGSPFNVARFHIRGETLLSAGGASLFEASSTGILATSADGDTWQNLLEGELYSVTGIADNGTQLLATTGSSVVWHGVDGQQGLQWQPYPTELLRAGSPVWAFGSWWCVVPGDLARSSDGIHWEKIGFDDLFIDSYRARLHFNGTVLVFASKNAPPRITTDGHTWQRGDDGQRWSDNPLFLESFEGRFYAGFPEGRLRISDDGDTWQNLSSLSTGSLTGMARNGSQWLIVTDANQVLKSADGMNWAAHARQSQCGSAVPNVLTGVTWFGGRFIAGGSDGSTWYSADGDQWTCRVSTHSWEIVEMAEGNGVFVVVDELGRIAASENGRDWTTTFVSVSSSQLDLLWTGRDFAILNGRSYHSSEDGLNWETHEALDFDIAQLVRGEDRSLALDSAGRVWSATDAEDWIQVSDDRQEFLAMAFQGGRFFGFDTAGVAVSEDGIAWERLFDYPEQRYFQPVRALYRDGKWVVTSPGGDVLISLDDGQSWLFRTVDRLAMTRSLTWTGSSYLLAASSGDLYASEDLLNWTHHVNAFEGELASLAAHDGTLVALDPQNRLYRSTDTFAVAQPTHPLRAVVPWVVHNDQWTSRIAIFNQGTRTGDILVRAVDQQGETRERMVTVNALAVATWQADTLFPGLSGYALYLHTDLPVEASFLTFNTEEVSGGMSPSQTTAPLTASLTSELVFGYLPGDQIGAIALVAGESTEDVTRVTLTLYDDQQSPLNTRELVLEGNRPTAILLVDLFPDTPLPANSSLTAVAEDGSLIAGTTFLFNLMRQPSMARAVSVGH